MSLTDRATLTEPSRVGGTLQILGSECPRLARGPRGRGGQRHERRTQGSMDARDSEVAPRTTSIPEGAPCPALRGSLQGTRQGRRRGRGPVCRAIPALRGRPFGHPATGSAGGLQRVLDAGGVRRGAPDGEAPQHDRRQPARPRLLDGAERNRDPDSGRTPLVARHARGPGHRGSPVGTAARRPADLPPPRGRGTIPDGCGTNLPARAQSPVPNRRSEIARRGAAARGEGAPGGRPSHGPGWPVHPLPNDCQKNGFS